MLGVTRPRYLYLGALGAVLLLGAGLASLESRALLPAARTFSTGAQELVGRIRVTTTRAEPLYHKKSGV